MSLPIACIPGAYLYTTLPKCSDCADNCQASCVVQSTASGIRIPVEKKKLARFHRSDNDMSSLGLELPLIRRCIRISLHPLLRHVADRVRTRCRTRPSGNGLSHSSDSDQATGVIAFPCFVLGKGSSYSYIGVHQVGDGATRQTVIEATQELAALSLTWELTRVDIKLYQVSSRLVIRFEHPFTFSQPDQLPGVLAGRTRADFKKPLLDTVNDEYLKKECNVVHSDRETSQECFMAIGELFPVSAGPRQR